jgi:hypothetical protein
MVKYDPLLRFLRRQKGRDVELSFREIERLLRAMLPNGAAEAGWWAGKEDPHGHPQSYAWRDVGYSAALIPGQEKVVFVREPRDGQPAE